MSTSLPGPVTPARSTPEIPRALHPAYRRSRELAERKGRSFYAATALLPRRDRPAIHALYAFARVVDDIVDHPEPGARPAGLEAQLDAVSRQLHRALTAPRGTGPQGQAPDGLTPDDLAATITAAADTARRYRIDPAHFDSFLAAMRSDARPRTVRTTGELDDYMYGSAAVIGLQVLPILGVTGNSPRAAAAAARLGEAFQLTNFIRDTGEDLRRGRIYLPASELAAFGVDGQLLRDAQASGTVPPQLRRALAHLIALARARYRQAEPGLAELAPRGRRCVRAALVLYREILAEIERQDYPVLTRRVVVSTPRRAALLAAALAR